MNFLILVYCVLQWFFLLLPLFLCWCVETRQSGYSPVGPKMLDKRDPQPTCSSNYLYEQMLKTMKCQEITEKYEYRPAGITPVRCSVVRALQKENSFALLISHLCLHLFPLLLKYSLYIRLSQAQYRFLKRELFLT